MTVLADAGVPKRLPLLTAVPKVAQVANALRHVLTGSLTWTQFGHSFPVGDLSRVLTEAQPVTVGEHPMYCVLLYTNVAGVDDAVDRWVHESMAYLDNLTGTDCAVMFVESRTTKPREGARGFSSKEVERIASQFGVQAPALVFFTDWGAQTTTGCIRVPLKPLLGHVPVEQREGVLSDVFAELFGAVKQVVSDGADAEKRRKALDKKVQRLTEPYKYKQRSRLQRGLRKAPAIVLSALAFINSGPSAEHKMEEALKKAFAPPPAHVAKPIVPSPLNSHPDAHRPPPMPTGGAGLKSTGGPVQRHHGASERPPPHPSSEKQRPPDREPDQDDGRSRP